MRVDASLRQLSESRLLACLRVGRRSQYISNVLLELLVNQHIILVVRNTQQILLRCGGKLQPDGRIRNRPDVPLNQSSDWLLNARLPERFGAGRIIDQWLH